MNAENLKFKSNAFDLITSFQVLEHTKNPLKVMTEMYRTLKPGGKILLTVPDIEAEKFSFYDYYTHIFPFTKKRMYFMIKSCGFKDIIIKKYTAPRFWHFLFPYKKIILPILFTFTRGSLLVIAKK
jgi:ubiquinone/menaquinone biosynthesis C-methylase UbiE